MSKYDQLNYLTRSEKVNKCFPKCIKNANKEDIVIPEELIDVEIEKIKSNFYIKTKEEDKSFDFVNNQQKKINENYFKNGNFLSDKMEKEEKRELLLDYINYHFGNIVDGKVFEKHLQDIFHLRKFNLNDKQFTKMIEDNFQKKSLDLNDPEDREKFKSKIFHQFIKYSNKKEEDEKPLFESQDNIDEDNIISNSQESEI